MLQECNLQVKTQTAAMSTPDSKNMNSELAKYSILFYRPTTADDTENLTEAHSVSTNLPK